MSGDSAENLYTAEQQTYVAGIDEKNLRAAVLHHVRLSELMSQDRDRFEKKHNDVTNKLINLRVLVGTEAMRLKDEADALRELGLEALPIENIAKRLVEISDPGFSM